MSSGFEFEKRLRELEHKAVMRKIWTDAARKVLPGIMFMAGSACILFAGPDNLTRIAAVLFYLGSFLWITL